MIFVLPVVIALMWWSDHKQQRWWIDHYRKDNDHYRKMFKRLMKP